MKKLSKYMGLFALAASCAFNNVAIAADKTILSKNWIVNKATSAISWEADWAGNKINGQFKNFDANIIFDENNLKSTNIIINIPMTGLYSNSKTAMENLPLKDWFNFKSYPSARFEAKEVQKTNSGFIANGFLTIKGVKYHLALPFALQKNGNSSIMTSKLNLDRINLKIGIESDPKAEWVSRNVALNIKVVATK